MEKFYVLLLRIYPAGYLALRDSRAAKREVPASARLQTEAFLASFRIWAFEIIASATILVLLFKQRRVAKKLEILLKIKYPFVLNSESSQFFSSAKISD